MQPSSAVKVGAMVVAGLTLIIAAWWLFANFEYNRYRIRVVFRDIKGLMVQTPVRMNGVKIGEVREITLGDDLRPVVTLSIYRDRKIPLNAKIRITSGLLISNPMVEIDPTSEPSSKVYQHGETWLAANVEETASALAQLSPEADQALKELTQTMSELRPRLIQTTDRLQTILKDTADIMVNVRDTTASARELVGNPKLKSAMNNILSDLEAMSKETRLTAATLSRELRALVKRNGGKFDELANGAIDLLQKLADTVDAARAAVTRLTEQVSDPRIQQALLETIELGKTTIARFNQIASDLHQLTGDANVQSDVKSTVASLKEASEQGQQIVERVNTLVSRINLPSSRASLPFSQPRVNLDFLARSNSPRFRSDLNVLLPMRDNAAILLGVHDFPDSNKLTAQYQTALSGGADLRYGLYASSLALGLELQPTRQTRIVLDAYNPNRPQMDVRALFDVNNDFAVWLGADSVFRRTTPLLGVRLKR